MNKLIVLDLVIVNLFLVVAWATTAERAVEAASQWPNASANGSGPSTPTTIDALGLELESLDGRDRQPGALSFQQLALRAARDGATANLAAVGGGSLMMDLGASHLHGFPDLGSLQLAPSHQPGHGVMLTSLLSGPSLALGATGHAWRLSAETLCVIRRGMDGSGELRSWLSLCSGENAGELRVSLEASDASAERGVAAVSPPSRVRVSLPHDGQVQLEATGRQRACLTWSARGALPCDADARSPAP